MAIPSSHRATALCALALACGVVSGAATPGNNPSADCRLNVTQTFGDQCFAAVKRDITDGASLTVANAKPGRRGSITVSCSGGKPIWSNETCTAATQLLQPEQAFAASRDDRPVGVASSPVQRDYEIGAYYFGGWKDNQIGSAFAMPWEQVRLYPDREPILGHYAEDAPGVMAQQLKWMRQYGIDFVVFNWFWSRSDAPVLDHALNAYLALPPRENVRFAVQWSNHTDYDFSRAQFEALFRFWARRYFTRVDYQRFNGKPVVFVFSAPTLLRNANAIGMTTGQLIKLADDVAKSEGLPGISVIGGMWGGDSRFDYGADAGYAGYTMYNYHSPANIALQPIRPGNYSHNYGELHRSYANQWDWMLRRTTLPYIVPMTSGWDKRPWGGSKDPLHDDSRGLPSEFEVHLRAAKALMDSNPNRTQRIGLVCCWNEFGEGSFVEPTKLDGFGYLEKVRNVFGTN